jgi:ribonuclease T2
MRELGPGYVSRGERRSLAAHEWAKHGSCTGLAAAAYFEAALSAMKSLPEKATPAKLRAAIGGDLALDELQRAFGVPVESVLLGCDDRCSLEQVGICLGHDAGNRPTTPVACPASTTRARYTNGCVTRGCDRVSIPAAGSCEVRPRGKRDDEPRPRNKRDDTRTCDRPGQGPACSDDAACKRQGFDRCARSGCCTSQPR